MKLFFIFPIFIIIAYCTSYGNNNLNFQISLGPSNCIIYQNDYITEHFLDTTRSDYSYNLNTDWQYWIFFNLGFKVDYQIFKMLSIGFVWENYLGYYKETMHIQPYLGIQASYNLKKYIDLIISGDFGYSWWCYPGNTYGFTTHFPYSGLGYSFQISHPISKSISIGLHFNNSFLSRKDKYITINRETTDIDGMTRVHG